MFPHYCNKCFRESKYDKELELHVSSCGHILCHNCLQSICPVCGRTTKTVPLCKTMPANMAEYFVNPFKHYQHFQKVVKFHNEQQRLYVQHFCRVHVQETAKLREHMQGYIKMHSKLVSELEMEQERIRKCREYLAYHEKRMENYYLPNQKSPVKLQPRLRYPMRKLNKSQINSEENHKDITQNSAKLSKILSPKTPTLSTLDSSSVTSDSETHLTTRKSPCSIHNPQYSSQLPRTGFSIHSMYPSRRNHQ